MTAELHASLDWSGLEMIDLDECYRYLGSCPVGRLGFVDRGEPVILPVNYALDGKSVVFRTGPGSKLALGMMQRPVCLEIDSWDLLEHSGWSVLVKGVADEVIDDTQIDHLETLPLRPWSRPDLRRSWVRIMVEEVTGRKIVPAD
jgi:nitroimidazol reductase NimA-like FMN-containing flavoprotein (pyridoxamine 5'-phosphate oxidase superfamily)